MKRRPLQAKYWTQSVTHYQATGNYRAAQSADPNPTPATTGRVLGGIPIRRLKAISSLPLIIIVATIVTAVTTPKKAVSLRQDLIQLRSRRHWTIQLILPEHGIDISTRLPQSHRHRRGCRPIPNAIRLRGRSVPPPLPRGRP